MTFIVCNVWNKLNLWCNVNIIIYFITNYKKKEVSNKTILMYNLAYCWFIDMLLLDQKIWVGLKTLKGTTTYSQKLAFLSITKMLLFFTYLKPVPLSAAPMRVQGLSTHICLMRYASKFDFNERISGITGPVHYWQVTARQHLHFYFSRHGSFIYLTEMSNFISTLNSLQFICYYWSIVVYFKIEYWYDIIRG